MSLVVGELSYDAVKLALGRHQHADIIYSDPPWGPGNLMYWRTMNHETERPLWGRFIHTLHDCVVQSLRPKGHLFIEMGLRWSDEIVDRFNDLPYKPQQWTIHYGNPKRPQHVLYWGPAQLDLDPNVSNLQWVKNCLQGTGEPSSSIVMDVCFGLGTTARAAKSLGMEFCGVELNPKRAVRTAKILGLGNGDLLRI